MNKKQISIFEIALLVLATVSFSFTVNQANIIPNVELPRQAPNPNLEKVLRALLGGNFVSAEEQGLFTCPVNNQGVVCQEYTSVTCSEQCQTNCFPGRREDFAECRLGTCLDQDTGLCSANTPKALCLERGGQFDLRAATEIPMCSKGCCTYGSNSEFVTERQCDIIRDQQGVFAQFQPASNEIQCIALAHAQDEGACVLGEVEPGRNACKRSTGVECQVMRGSFYPGLLCSNPDLNTICEPQVRASCTTGKDEVYWFDSCNNRENIVDYAKRNELKLSGRIVSKEDSCKLGSVNNPFANQARCGNCNYLSGSVCGTFLEGNGWQKLQAGSSTASDVVCRDLSCTDESGTTRKHGESWCAFDGAIGTQGTGNAQRGTDVVGSRNYKMVCLNGEIREEPCQDFRNEVCVESRNEEADFSQASCRINQWQACIAANQQPTVDAMKTECLKHTDCFIKNVDLRGQLTPRPTGPGWLPRESLPSSSKGNDNFAFSVCAPKYAPGFDLQAPQGVEVAESVCGIATQTCTFVKVKGLFSSKTVNGNCLTSDFTETMNNLCMSLGDCGGKVNVAGEFTDDGYKVTNAQDLRAGYKDALENYAEPVNGQKVQPLSNEEIAMLLGLPGGFGAINTPQGSTDLLSSVGGIAGALGTAVSVLQYAGISALFQPAVVVEVTSLQGAIIPGAPVIAPYLGAATGAFVGAAATSYLLTATGVSGGLPASIAIAIVIAGAYAGAFIGYGVATAAAGQTIAGAACATGYGCIIGAIVLVVISLLYAFGIGKKKTASIEFQCLPWQPPLGGDKCGQCGENGLTCSPYKCQSLGQTCRYVEDAEGGLGACIDVSPDDSSAPTITTNPSVLPTNYQYSNVNDLGFTLRGTGSDGCVSRFERVQIGIRTNELARCRIDNVHTDSFDEMIHAFHNLNGIESNQFRTNHTFSFSIPGREALDNEAQLNSEHDPEGDVFDEELTVPRDGRVDLYVRCTDMQGNSNVREYAINFCASAEPDRSPPLISRFSPPSPSYIALDAGQQQVGFYTSEPSECRWSDRDVDYESMSSQASCITDLAAGNYLGWACNATLPAPTGSEATYYFRCNDQPWRLGNETDGGRRNANAQGVAYTLKSTTTPLSIVSVSPSNQTLTTNGVPYSLNLEVHTEGGAPNSVRTCSFEWGGSSINFLETGTDRHRQPNLNLYLAGNYTVPINCRDSAGNTASRTLQFTLALDSKGPTITRAYSREGLTVITNEQARCAFSLNSCSFTFANGTLMQGIQNVHTSPFSGDLTHYIVCRDRFDNVGNCLAVRRGIL